MDEEALLKRYANSLGLDGRACEALQRGDVQTLIWNVLSERISDPLLATVLQVMLVQNHSMVSQLTAQDEANRQPARQPGRHDIAVISSPDSTQSGTALVTLRHVTRMLGACPRCCGEEMSCPECHGGGKPGSVPSIVSAEEFRAWIEPALDRMGMRIAEVAPANDSIIGGQTQPTVSTYADHTSGSQ
jgi:hypothetical protein